MNNDDFVATVDSVLNRIDSLLVKKGKEYAPGVDRLHHFHAAAELTGQDPIHILRGFMVKHTISIYDMLEHPEDHKMDLWDEKIGDHIAYLVLLKALLVDVGEIFSFPAV